MSLTIVTAAVGTEYHDPSGFSFTYPDGWFAAAKLGNLNKLPPELASWITKNHIDLNQVAVVLIHAGRGDFMENLNVVVVHQEMPLTDATIREIVEGLPKQYRSMGISIENLDGREQQVGNNQAIVLDYRSRLPGLPLPIRQRQYYLPLAGNTYIVTCTAKAEAFANSGPVFDKIVESFSTPGGAAGKTSDPNTDRILMFGVIGGAVFGMIGAIVAALKTMKRQEGEFVASGAGRYQRGT